jgi:mRNA interferase MazF
MKDADVILTPLPQADGKVKNRPALLLRELPPFGDFLACGVSTQIQQAVPGFDEVVSPGDLDFEASGLLAASVIRLGFLAVLPRQRILGSIGAIDITRHARLLRNLSNHLVANLDKAADSAASASRLA